MKTCLGYIDFVGQQKGEDRDFVWRRGRNHWGSTTTATQNYRSPQGEERITEKVVGLSFWIRPGPVGTSAGTQDPTDYSRPTTLNDSLWNIKQLLDPLFEWV